MKIIKLLGAAFFAVLALGGMAAATASAFHPLFLTESKKELLFFGEGGDGHLVGGLPTLRVLMANVLGTITCELILIHGFALEKSMLAHRIKILLENKCELVTGGTRTPCNEPIESKTLLGELGLVLLNNTVGLALEPSDGTNVFFTITCGNTVITVEGSVIAEIPEISADTHLNQYNKLLTLVEVVWEALNRNSDIQNITHIELLGITLEKLQLNTGGFFGGKASFEAAAMLHFDGKIEICTRPNGIGCE